MQRFTDIKAWQRGHQLVLAVYRATSGFPVVERYGLISQLRRAALSVPTNIAEGSKRTGRTEYARFLNIVEASLAETEYLIMVGRDLGYMTSLMAKPLLLEVADLARMLHSLRLKVQASNPTTP